MGLYDDPDHGVARAHRGRSSGFSFAGALIAYYAV